MLRPAPRLTRVRPPGSPNALILENDDILKKRNKTRVLDAFYQCVKAALVPTKGKNYPMYGLRKPVAIRQSRYGDLNPARELKQPEGA